MRKLIEDTRVFVAEIIGFAGGCIWGYSTGWDYEPIILIAVSTIGLVTFITLRFFPSQDDRPVVELEFKAKSSLRRPPEMILSVSPMDPSGQFYIWEEGGVYMMSIEKQYDLVIRNNSANNAYDLTLFRLSGSNRVTFERSYNHLEPLVVGKQHIIPFSYQVMGPMTHQEADIISRGDLPDDLKQFQIIAKYRSESQVYYYTKFTPLKTNEQLTKVVDIQLLDKI